MIVPHYLVKLIQNPNLQDPSEEIPEVHNLHFTRYSRGNFSGPMLKITITSKTISLNGSFEMENALQKIAVDSLPDNEDVYSVTGQIIASEDVNNDLIAAELPFQVNPPNKKVKTKNFKGEISGALTKKELLNLITQIGAKAYILFSMKTDASVGVSVTTKKNPPRPNQKNPEDSAPDKLVQFCKIKVPNSKDTLSQVIEDIIPDFDQDLPSKLKKRY